MTSVKLEQKADGSARLFVDGRPVEARSVFVRVEVGHPAEAEIELVPRRTDYSGPTKVRVSDDTKEFLISIGWTPPAGD